MTEPALSRQVPPQPQLQLVRNAPAAAPDARGWMFGALLAVTVAALLFGWLGYRAGQRDAKHASHVLLGGPLG